MIEHLKPLVNRNLVKNPQLILIFSISKLILQSGTTDGTATDVSSSDSKVDIKDFKVRNSQEEISVTQGIKIRRRPPTGPPTHYVGPFEFRLQNEGNTPRNILEEIVWNKDVEVAQVYFPPLLLYTVFCYVWPF